jgi:aspartate 1-decarboxylase
MDGAADKIISQCGVCALHMEGDAAHAVQVGDYTLHMCSAACKDAWEKDPTGSMAALAEAAQ